MSIVWILLAVAACAASSFCAARYARASMERERLIAEIEDPRDSQLRELLIAAKVARENALRAKAGESSSSEELVQARDRIRTLEKTAATANDQVETMQGRLEDLLGERNELEEQLAKLRRDKERLLNRAQELEMELSMGKAGDLLDPAIQAS
jgi:chromosome segregation ATPase